MYEAHFGFHCKPFSLLPDPGFLYLSRRHRTALSLLEYGLVNQAGFTVVCGEVGCGKTTLVGYLLERMDPDCTVGAIHQTHAGFGELLAWVLMVFGLPHEGASRVQHYAEFARFVKRESDEGRRVVLIVDEAQNLDCQVLEELRLLSNINSGAAQQLQLILVGQPELQVTLARPELRQFAQRVAVDYFLGALDASETAAYVTHRCQIAGASRALFTSTAIQRIHEASGGVPRLVNLLCDTALVYAFGAGAGEVTLKRVEEVLRDRSADSGGIGAAALAHAAGHPDG